MNLQSSYCLGLLSAETVSINHTHPKGGLQAWQTEGKSENGEAVGLTFKGQASKEKSLRRRLAARSQLRFLG